MGAVCGKEEETSNSSSSLPQQSKIYPALEDPDDDKEQLERQSKEAKVIMEEESPEQKLYSNVILATKNALGHLESFGDAFVEQTFQTDFHSHHMTWLDMRYDWFVPYEEVPKNLFEPTDRDYLTSLNRESGLQLTEKLLKKIEQCLDMVAREMDMNEETSEFAELFKVSRDFSKAAATEVEIAMEELEISSGSDLSEGSEFIPHELTSMGDTSQRSMRDWFIYRDSRNALEFFKELFEELKTSV